MRTKSLSTTLSTMTLAATVLALPLLGGCKKKAPPRDELTEPAVARPLPAPSKLEGYARVCDGAKVEAKAYEKHADKTPSKVVVFRKYVDDKTPLYAYEKVDDLEGFQVASNDELGDVELVACVDLKKKEQTRSQCSYNGGTIHRFTMSYVARIVDPVRGEEVAREEFELSPLSTGCKSTAYFREGSTSVYEGASYGGRLLTTLLPLQPEGVTLPPLAAGQLDDVCTGTPRPQALAAASPEQGTVHVAYQPTKEYSWGLEARPAGLPKNEESTANPTKAKYVACVTGQPVKEKASCAFTSGKVLSMQDGTVDVVLRETRTGIVVATKSFKATSGACPSVHDFWDNKDIYFGRVDVAVYDHLAAFVGGTIPGSKKERPMVAGGGLGLGGQLF